MSRVTLTLENAWLQSIQQIATQRGIALSQYLRHLVELGWQAENSELEGAVTPNPLPSDSTLSLWQQGLSCWLESRYLLRYLVDTLDQPAVERDAVLQAVKLKAQEVAAEYCAHYSSNSIPLSNAFSKAGLEG